MSRTALIAGNWKMHKTASEAEDFLAALLPRLSGLTGVSLAAGEPAQRAQAGRLLDLLVDGLRFGAAVPSS